MSLIEIFVITALVRIALILGDHWVPTGIYVAYLFIILLFSGESFSVIIINILINGSMMALYLWLTAKLEGAGVLFWVTVVGGAAIIILI